MNSACAYPSVWQYLKAALAGSIAGAVPTSTLTVVLVSLCDQPFDVIAVLTVTTMLLYIAFLVIGLPIFLTIRRTRWFRFPFVVIGAGIFAAFCTGALTFRTFGLWVAAGVGMGAVLAAAVCWWGMRPTVAIGK